MSKTEKLKIYEIHKMSILPNLENDDKSKTVLELSENGNKIGKLTVNGRHNTLLYANRVVILRDEVNV